MQYVRGVFAGCVTFLALAAFCICVQSRSYAGDLKAGRAKAETCAVCHGIDGLAKIPDAPNLAGQNERYLIEQLSAFQAGIRNNEMMSIVIKDLSQTDIEDLAAYYSAIEITVAKIPGG
ncbi:c-type cytochrome [Roseiarcus sp.]|jgi:cytochrome c553|uniref:c-type cytochrome n=2 Tax=Roseiarcus sp. TaxID=1969460 RepID=UPI003C78DF90